MVPTTLFAFNCSVVVKMNCQDKENKVPVKYFSAGRHEQRSVRIAVKGYSEVQLTFLYQRDELRQMQRATVEVNVLSRLVCH